MRTTVTLDADTEQIVRERRLADGVSFKRALNDAIRDGAARRPRPPVFRSPVFALGEPSVDLTHALRLAADLEDQGILQRQQAD